MPVAVLFVSKSLLLFGRKGKSVLMLFDRHPEFRRKNSGRNFWARGYYVVTVGNVNESTIVNYIREQEENDKLVLTS